MVGHLNFDQNNLEKSKCPGPVGLVGGGGGWGRWGGGGGLGRLMLYVAGQNAKLPVCHQFFVER